MGGLDEVPDVAARDIPSESKHVSVLVVDDDNDTRDALSELLERAGYTVATAANGAEALAFLHAGRPELILLDVCMPEMDGATFRQYQRRNPEWLRIPTVVMTGAYEEPFLDLALAEALRKPVRAEQVLAIVARHVRRA
jgi:CheY-like chemotaxis protein